MQGVIHAGFMYHACITLCHTSDWDFSNIYMIFLLSMYLNYKGLVWYGSEHPGVPFSDIRVWGVVTSGCRKPEDGHVTKLFCLLFVLFLLVLVKKDLYVEGTISTQMYFGTVPCVFVNNTGYPFQRQVVIQVWYRNPVCITPCTPCLSMLAKQSVIEW